jgi:hypothetical protein
MDFDRVLKENRDLYLFQLDSGRIMFKLLDYESYKTIRYIMQAYPDLKFDLEDRVWDDCVLEHTFPYGKEYIPAGIATTTAQLILHLSCPSSIDSINTQLSQARVLLTDAREQAIITICEAFPSYLPEDLEKMTWSMLLRRLAQAEAILKRQFEFTAPASQPLDDSGKIFDRLKEYTENAVDFAKVNKELYKEEFGKPSGDFNLNNNRGR